MKKILKKNLYIILLSLIICIPLCLYGEKFNRRDNDTTDLQKHLHNVKFDGHLYVVYKEKKRLRNGSCNGSFTEL